MNCPVTTITNHINNEIFDKQAINCQEIATKWEMLINKWNS